MTLLTEPDTPRAYYPFMTNENRVLKHLTPVLVVERVEPCLAFWVDRLGFTAEHQVPGPDGALMFGSVRAGDVEVMYQTRASVEAELPESAGQLSGKSAVLFITVNDLDAVERSLAGAPVVKARHKTVYGSTEVYVREPGGYMVGFAQF